MNTERPKLKLNLATKPLALNTDGGTLVAGSALKRVVVVAKPKESIATVGNSPAISDKTNITTAATRSSSKEKKKSKKQETVVSSKQAVKESKKQELVANQKVAAKVPTPEEILKEKIKRRKKEYFSILTKLQTDFPASFSKEPKPLAIGIDTELKKILNSTIPNVQLSRFFHRYCGSFKYKETLVEGAQRFNLDGSPATLITTKEVPVLVHKPKFVKKGLDASDTAKTASNKIDLSNE